MKYFDSSHPAIVCLLVLFCVTQRGAYCELEEEFEFGGDKTERWTEKTEDGDIEIQIFKNAEECDRKSEDGDVLVVKYQAIMPVSGVEFDNSANRKRPFHFTLGEGRVMKAWEIGLKGMCIGEQRGLTIPPGPLQKGDQGSGAMIPHDDEILTYAFELLAIRDSPPPINMFKEMDADGDNAIQKEEMLAYLKNEGLGGLKDEETVDDVIDNIFEGQDQDGDQTISHEEFGGPKHDEF
ncbi:peptidyl-prolyl cis-trans isomerase FKBP14-like isoform X2 [Amphiura filiformis]|uniref:peptidyl-prolyl cis-trans isomerase FKBP14-like isoform X2 n=1 Tax=Amphiura filiformis TaxID=82378 RepID=UPI003B21A0C8